MAPFAPLRVTCLQTHLPPYRLTALPSRHAPTPPRATRAQVRRCVAGRFHRRSPRRRDRSPSPCRADRRGRLRDGGDYRCAPGSGATGRERRVAHRGQPRCAAPRPSRRSRAVAASRRPAPGRRAALHQRPLRRAGGAGAGTAAATRAHPPHHRLPGLPRRASERAARRRRAGGRGHPRPLRGRDGPGAHRRRISARRPRTTPAPTAPSSESSRPCSAAAWYRSCRASSAPRPRARSPPWVAAAPISPPRSSPGGSARRGSRSGRTCPAS